jgi:hypothetical protein
MLPCDLTKTREICFACLPPGQSTQAMQVLSGIDHLDVQCSARKNCILVSYNVAHITLEDLENALIAQNFHLENSLLQKIVRALVYYSEQVQRENLEEPERVSKSQQIFVQAYQHHPHGDHDETPVEWREYR